MKSTASNLLISGLIILLFLTGTFIWRYKHHKQIPKFNEQSFNAPVSSKYIPTNTDLVFHWKINPTILPKYIENYQAKVSKNSVNKKISLIRDSSFKLISLDFANDISKWVGDYGSFALLDSDDQQVNDWIIVLAIKDNINIKEELDSIVGSNIIAETNSTINELKNSKTEIISKKINPNKSIYFANDKNNLLIASNSKIIQSSIKKLDSNLINTRKMHKLIQLKNYLKDGIFLLEISPKRILNILGQEDDLFSINQVDNLISSINLDKKKLILEGILSFNDKTNMPVKEITYNLFDIKKDFELSKDLILVDNPNQYFSKDSSHPYQKLIASLIKESSSSDNYNIFKIILENSIGNLIWINDKSWLVITRKSDTRKEEISHILERENFLSSNLDFQNRTFEIWSKISTDKNQEYELQENIEAIIEEDNETYIWSKNLTSIANFNNNNYFQNSSYNEQKSDEMNDFDDLLKIHLGKEKTKTFLNNFYPYILFKTLLGNKLTPPQNIDISISVPTINYSDFMKVKINLKTS